MKQDKYMLLGFSSDKVRDEIMGLVRIHLGKEGIFLWASCQDADAIQQEVNQLKEDYEP